MKRRAYRATEVKNVLLEEVLRSAPAGAATAGLDIGKYEVRAVVRWKEGSFERPWKARNTSEIEAVVGLLRKVADHRALIVAMESTGTYGDALRAKLDQAGLEVHRVGGKAAHDYAEVFDGVPSQHDGKDAAVIAELAAFGKSSPTAPCSTVRAGVGVAKSYVLYDFDADDLATVVGRANHAAPLAVPGEPTGITLPWSVT